MAGGMTAEAAKSCHACKTLFLLAVIGVALPDQVGRAADTALARQTAEGGMGTGASDFSGAVGPNGARYLIECALTIASS